MASRKAFVAAAAASVGAIVATANAASAAPSPEPSPSPTSSPSPASREFARRMRAFDPNLSDADVDAIAAGIETNWKLGNSVNKGGKALKNSEEPIPPFSVP